jgi:V/A-type H+-transporting ATPase subunit I
MKRIEILALLEDSQKLLDLLQRRGYIEVTDSEETDSLYKLATQSSLSIFEKGRSAALAALATLETYAPRKHSCSVLWRSPRTDRCRVLNARRRCGRHHAPLLRHQRSGEKIADLKPPRVHIGAQLDAVTPWLGLDVRCAPREQPKPHCCSVHYPGIHCREPDADCRAGLSKKPLCDRGGLHLKRPQLRGGARAQ